MQYAINTNWPVLRTVNAPTLYLLDSTGWLTSETLTTGVWGTRTRNPSRLRAVAGYEGLAGRQAESLPGARGAGAAADRRLDDAGRAHRHGRRAAVPAGARHRHPRRHQHRQPGVLGRATRRRTTTWWPAAGSAPTGSAVRGRTPADALPADLANIPADGPLAAVLALGAEHAGSARGRVAGADSAPRHRQPHEHQRQRRVRRRSAVRARSRVRRWRTPSARRAT